MAHVRPVGLDALAHVVAIVRGLADRLAEGAQALGVQVLDRRAHHRQARGEVVQHRPARQPRLLGDQGRGGARVAVLDEALDGSLGDLGAGRGALLRLPAQGRGIFLVVGGGLGGWSHVNSFLSQACTACLKKSKMIETGYPDC